MASVKEHHQRNFDDFSAIAEDLIARKITSPEHLGIMGGSQGGFILAVFMLPAKTRLSPGHVAKLANYSGMATRPVSFLTGTCEVFPFTFTGQAVALSGFLAEPMHVFLGVIPGDHDDRSVASSPVIVTRV